MRKKIKIIDGLLILLIFGSLFTKDAGAYLDPGSSSYLLQILLAGFFSGLLMIKTFWKRISFFIKSFFNKKSDKDKKNDEEKKPTK